MICQVWFTALVLLLQQVSVVCAEQLSYLRVKSLDYKESDESSLLEMISKPDVEGPLIILDFADPQILEELVSSDEKYPFLTSFLTNDEVPIVFEDEPSHFENDARVAVFELAEIPPSISAILYDYAGKEKSIFMFRFTNTEYDAAALDQFLGSTLVFLGRSLSKVENVIVNVHKLGAHEAHRHSKKDHQNEAKVDENEDDDILSKTWTEGLLMCLLVSALLLGVLIVAIGWTSSIEISYGALERPSNPMKKNK